jgi:hypothetical protein
VDDSLSEVESGGNDDEVGDNKETDCKSGTSDNMCWAAGFSCQYVA